MSQANVEVIRAVADTAREGDVGAWLRAMDPDVRLYPRPEEPGVRPVYEGWEGVMEYMTNWFGQWEDYEADPVEYLDAGDRVLVVFLERGRMERGGIEIEQEFSHSFTLRDGRIVEWRSYDSHQQGLEAVGLTGADGD
jgi:ketosteroid isomerase-like protein